MVRHMRGAMHIQVWDGLPWRNDMYVRRSGRQAKICDFPQKIFRYSSGLLAPHIGMLSDARQEQEWVSRFRALAGRNAKGEALMEYDIHFVTSPVCDAWVGGIQ